MPLTREEDDLRRLRFKRMLPNLFKSFKFSALDIDSFGASEREYLKLFPSCIQKKSLSLSRTDIWGGGEWNTGFMRRKLSL